MIPVIPMLRIISQYTHDLPLSFNNWESVFKIILVALIFFELVSVLAVAYYFKDLRPEEKEQREYFRKNENKDFRNF